MWDSIGFSDLHAGEEKKIHALFSLELQQDSYFMAKMYLV